MNVKPLGDKLIVKRADPQGQTDSGTEVKIDGDDYLIMTENDILGIIE